MAVPTVIIEEATGDVSAVDPGIDHTICVIGCASGVDETISLYGTKTGVRNARGEGPASRLAAHVLAENAGKALCVFYETPSTNVGTFGTPDDSLFLGTVEPAFSGEPLDSYQLYWTVVDDGNEGAGAEVGTAGIRYQSARDIGRTIEGPSDLGTAYSYTFPDTGVTLLLDPPLTALVAFVTDIREKVLAHFAEGSLIHTAADAVSGAGIGGVPVTKADCIARMNQIRAAAVLHGARLASHGVADTTLLTGALAPVAVTAQDVVTLGLDIKAKMNVHHTNVTGSMHGAGTDTHTITGTMSSRGTLKTGDTITVETAAPTPNADDVTAAFAALKTSAQQFGFVACAFPVDAAMAAIIKAGLDTIAARGKRELVIYSARNFNEAETEQEWLDAVKLDFAAFHDSRATVCATPCYQTLDDGKRVREWKQDALAAICARIVGYDLVSQSPGEVSLGALKGTRITTTAGDLLPTAHDEGGDIQGLDGAHFLTLMRLPDPTRATGVYITWPWVMYEVGTDRIQTLMTRRVANKGERIMAAVGFGELGSALTYIPGTLPGTGAISVPAANIIKRKMLGPLTAESGIKREISNPDDPDLVSADRNVTVDGEKVYVSVFLNLTPFKYVGKVTITLNIKQ